MGDKLLDDDFIPETGSTFVLRNVATKEEALDLIDLLWSKGIHARYTKDSGDLDYVFQGETPINKFEIHVTEYDREASEKIMTQKAQELLNDVESDYYLFSFSNDELMDVLIQKNEWNEFDVLLSEKILNDRGVNVNKTVLDEKREERNKELAKPEGGQTVYIIIGYITAFLGGFIGLVLGYFIWQAKNKLPNGTKVYSYKESIRKHGQIIFFISLVIFTLGVILRILGFFAQFRN